MDPDRKHDHAHDHVLGDVLSGAFFKNFAVTGARQGTVPRRIVQHREQSASRFALRFEF
jgi:hypothetical protein